MIPLRTKIRRRLLRQKKTLYLGTLSVSSEVALGSTNLEKANALKNSNQ